MRIVYLTSSIPNQVGHGGTHRAYQVTHDINQAFVNVSVLPLQSKDIGANVQFVPFLLKRALNRLARSYHRLSRNPLHWSLPNYTSIMSTRWVGEHHRRTYEHFLLTNKVDVCIIGHPKFYDFLSINQKLGIPTIACFENIESLDTLPTAASGLPATVALDLSQEIRLLAQCDERLFISRVETGLLRGLGIRAEYYPYAPVGIIRERCLNIRQARLHTEQKRMCLLLGSAAHATTGHSFQWLLGGLAQIGLPKDLEIVVGGIGTDTLPQTIPDIPDNIRCLGWLEQTTLDDLLIKCSAVLVPQLRGFGALTRLSELGLMGIPVIVSDHATFATEVPAHFLVLPENVQLWHDAIMNIAVPPTGALPSEQVQQENKSTLVEVLARIL